MTNDSRESALRWRSSWSFMGALAPSISFSYQVPVVRGSAETNYFWSQDRERIMGNRLYVGNLSFNSTQDTLREAFAAHGEVVDVHLVADRMTGQSRGFGFVTMGSRSEAEGAMSAMNGADLDGRALRVNEAEALRRWRWWRR